MLNFKQTKYQVFFIILIPCNLDTEVLTFVVSLNLTEFSIYESAQSLQHRNGLMLDQFLSRV